MRHSQQTSILDLVTDTHRADPDQLTIGDALADARLGNFIASAERANHEPPCRDCEVGEPHVCPLLPTSDALALPAILEARAKDDAARGIRKCPGCGCTVGAAHVTGSEDCAEARLERSIMQADD